MSEFLDVTVPVVAIASLFLGLPWIILHYVTKWKQGAKITPEDENLLDELYTLARRLEDRVVTVERIVAADHPDFRPTLAGTAADGGREAVRDWRQPNYQIDRRN